jgi:nitroreductase
MWKLPDKTALAYLLILNMIFWKIRGEQQMEILEAINLRHSVRGYTDKVIDGETLDQLKKTVDECNSESGLKIQLCLNEPEAFAGFMAKYGKFTNVKNYIALIGKKDGLLEEKMGYYGEKIVIKAQQLGLNTCWVAMTYNKGKSTAQVKPGEKLLMVISLGFGETNGVSRKPNQLKSYVPLTGICLIGLKKGWKRYN